jgi:hypothetical protein
MKRSLIVGLVCLLVMALAPVARTDESTLKIARVQVSSSADAAYLFNHFDETHNHQDGFVELLLWPGDAAELDAAGFAYEIVESDLLERDRAAFAEPGAVVELPGPDRSDYRRLADYNSEMKELAKKNPGLVRLIKLPHETLEGRRVFGLEIAANVGRIDGRPVMHIDGVHHAREWPAGEFPMIFAHYLIEGFGKDRQVTGLLKRLRVTIVPIVNPDGFDYSRESLVDSQGAAALPLAILGAESYWRKNRHSFSGVTVPAINKNPDAFGVDPNRNYGYLWGQSGGGSSGSEASQTYRGEAPFSEPEAANIREHVLSRHVTGLLTNHTYGDLVLRPWGHTTEDAPDERALELLGAKLSEAMGGYKNQKGIGLYATTGTTDDWSYAVTGGYGYTLEHGGSFHPPYAEGVGTKVKGVMKAYMLMGESAAAPASHGVLEGRVVDRDGNPVKATLRITKSFKSPLGDGNPDGRAAIKESINTVTKTSARGTFEWHVNPSTRPIMVDKGKTEVYELSVVSRSGCSGSRKVLVRRGQILDLGTIRLSRLCIDVVGIPGQS